MAASLRGAPHRGAAVARGAAPLPCRRARVRGRDRRRDRGHPPHERQRHPPRRGAVPARVAARRRARAPDPARGGRHGAGALRRRRRRDPARLVRRAARVLRVQPPHPRHRADRTRHRAERGRDRAQPRDALQGRRRPPPRDDGEAPPDARLGRGRVPLRPDRVRRPGRRGDLDRRHRARGRDRGARVLRLTSTAPARPHGADREIDLTAADEIDLREPQPTGVADTTRSKASSTRRS